MKKTVFLAIAHRGASAYAPENTFAAFDRALQLGAHQRLEETRLYAPEQQTDWLVGEVSEEIIATSKRVGMSQLCSNTSTLTQDIVKRLHNDGFIVRAWGVPSEKVMREVVQLGADGMTINFPDRLIQYLLMTRRE